MNEQKIPIEAKIRLNKFSPRDYQLPVADALENKGYKRILFISPRRSGKDIVAWNLMIRAALRRVAVYFYIFPTYNQGRKVIWDSITISGMKFLDFIPPQLIESTNSQEMKVRLKNGSIIQLVGSDNVDSLVGSNPYGLVFSEYALQDPRAYQFLRPILLANDGWALFVSTPRGKNHMWELYNIAKESPDWFCHKIGLDETNHIPIEEIEKERAEGLISEDLIQQEYYCFPDGQHVITDSGCKPIESIKPNDMVISHTGRTRKVIDTISREYDGELIEISSYGSSENILCTPEHPIYIYDRLNQSYEWKKAERITRHDRLVFPKMYLGQHKLISYELCMLLAWYITEGSCCDNAVQFTVGSDEEAQRISNYFNKLNITSGIRWDITSPVRNVIVNSTQLVDFFKTNCGLQANDKKIPFDLIGGYQEEFLHELVLGDGCHSLSKGHEKYVYSTVSRTLSYQVQLLANSLKNGYAAGISVREPYESIIEDRHVHCQKSYQVNVSFPGLRNKFSWLSRAKYCIAAQVKSVEKIKYKGLVHNLKVQYDESYLVGGRAVHNCSFEMGVEGSYYLKYLDKMRVSGQIGIVPWESAFKVHTAWDIGVSDSTVIIFFQTIGQTVRIIDYYEKSKEGLEHYVKVINSKPYSYGKHIAPHDIAVTEWGSGMSRIEKAKQLGVTFITAPNITIEDGIEAVRSSFSKIWIDDVKCKQLIKSLENYRQEWDSKKRVYKGQPLHDWSSHACFIAETLISTDQGDIEIKNIIPGMRVRTPFGFRKVLNTHSRMVEGLTDIFVGKTKITTTRHHDIFTSNGLVKSDSLSYNDIMEYDSFLSRWLWKKIYSFYYAELNLKGFKKSFSSLKMNRKSSLMGIILDGMDIITSQQKQRLIKRPISIDIFGFISKEISRINTIFTTLTETLKIILLRILNAFQRPIIFVHMLISQVLGLNPKLVVGYSNLKMQKPLNGIEVMQEKNGIENTHMNLYPLLPGKNMKKHVSNVQRNISENRRGSYSVLMHVKQGLGLLIKKTSLIGLVVFVKTYSFVINTLLKKHVVKNVESYHLKEPMLVYDLTIEVDNCYYANGYLVSNSDAMRYLCISLPKTRDGLSAEDLDKRYQEAIYGDQARMPSMFRDNKY